jgi:uncharacterized protein YegP (UPF0339 family)
MAKFVIYKDVNRKYRWRFIAANNEIVCWAEDYESNQAAKDSINFVKKYANGAVVNDLT